MSESTMKPEYLLIKWIVISPGDALDVLQTSDVIREYETNSYDAVKLILEDIPDVEFSKKDTDLFQFVFDYTSDVRFQCCSECKYMTDESHVHYSNSYQCGYLAVKSPNEWVKKYLTKICHVNGYACKIVNYLTW